MIILEWVRCVLFYQTTIAFDAFLLLNILVLLFDALFRGVWKAARIDHHRVVSVHILLVLLLSLGSVNDGIGALIKAATGSIRTRVILLPFGAVLYDGIVRLLAFLWFIGLLCAVCRHFLHCRKVNKQIERLGRCCAPCR